MELRTEHVAYAVGGCPACPGASEVYVLMALDSSGAVYYCPACETAWREKPDPEYLDEVRSLEEVAPRAGVRHATERDLAALELLSIAKEVPFRLWGDALRRIPCHS